MGGRGRDEEGGGRDEEGGGREREEGGRKGSLPCVDQWILLRLLPHIRFQDVSSF